MASLRLGSIRPGFWKQRAHALAMPGQLLAWKAFSRIRADGWAQTVMYIITPLNGLFVSTLPISHHSGFM